MKFCLGLLIVLWILGIIIQLVSNKFPAPGYDESEIMLAIMLMEDDERTKDGHRPCSSVRNQRIDGCQGSSRVRSAAARKKGAAGIPRPRPWRSCRQRRPGRRNGRRCSPRPARSRSVLTCRAPTPTTGPGAAGSASWGCAGGAGHRRDEQSDRTSTQHNDVLIHADVREIDRVNSDAQRLQ